jgi:hypothetical protein
MFLARQDPVIRNVRSGRIDIRFSPRKIALFDRAFGDALVDQLTRCLVHGRELAPLDVGRDPSMLFGRKRNRHALQ